MSLVEKLLEPPPFFTAGTDSSPTHPIVRAASLRRAMRYAARFNASHPPETEISVYKHSNGYEPKLVARRTVADRYWKYVEGHR